MKKGINRLISNMINAEYKEEDIHRHIIDLKILQKDLEDHIKAIKDFASDHVSHVEKAEERGENKHDGYEVKYRSGRRMISYSNIPDWVEAKGKLDEVQNRYKLMLDAKLAGNPHANIDEDGVELPLPEISYAKGFVIIERTK